MLVEYADEAQKTGDISLLSSNIKKLSRELEHEDSTHPDKNVFSLLNLDEIYHNRGGIRSGISLIDNVIGGMMPKELSLILADTNVGKSLLATYIGGQALRQMRKVLHVTLEMSRARTLIRYFSTLAEEYDTVTYGQIHNFSPEDDVYNYVEKLREKYEGYLFVEEFPPGTCTVENLNSLLEKYPGVELLIVDYLDLMKASQKREQLRFELSDITTDLRALAAEANIHVNTPTQATRTASGRRLVGKEHASEDYGKMRIPDWAVAMGQSASDLAKHEVLLSIARSRNSEKNFAERYLMDFQHMKFRLIAQEILGGLPDGH